MNKELLKLSPKEFCRETSACSDGLKFALKHKTMRQVWENCPRVDWLCWILNALDVPFVWRFARGYGMGRRRARRAILKHLFQ